MHWLLAAAALLQTASASPPAFDAAAAVRHLGFERGALREVRVGAIVTAYPEREADNELAVAAAVLVRAPVDEVLAIIRSDGLLDADEAVDWHETLDAQAADGAFDRVRFGRDEVDEVVELIAVEAGERFNLSAGEIAAISEAGRPHRSRWKRKKPAAVEAIGAAYAEVLAGRFDAYVERGPAGIEPYARDKGATSSPREALAAAETADTPLLEPWAAAEPDPRLHLVKRTVDDRPAFVLADRVIRSSDDGFIVVEQHYFVGHSYNASRWTCIGVATEGGTLVLSCHRVFTDQVTGVGSSATRRLGQRSLRKEAVAQMERLRTLR